MDPIDLCSRTLDLFILAGAPLALFGVGLRSHVDPDTAGGGKHWHVEAVAVVMIAVALFGLMQ